MDKILQDQVAIVTGGTAGIGKAIALKYAENGAKVAIFGQNNERGQQIVDEIGEAASFFQVNVANTRDVQQAINHVIEKWGKVDILVNNAGITRDQLLLKMSEDDWDNVMAINVKSCYNTCRAVVRSMMKQRKGKIINMSSVVGITGNAGQANYAASKAAVIGFTKALAKELASRNICVNVIAPGFIETKMTEVMTEAQKEATVQQIPFGRIGSPADIADMALYLASPKSDYITGKKFVIDGGMVM